MKRKPLPKTLILGAMAWGLSACALAQVTSYRGMCDASAAVAIGPDRFVAGDDEQSVLRIYRVGKTDPVGHVDLAKYLGVERKGKSPKETDIEGAARIGDRIYWITSHGRDGDGQSEPGRHRFFATTVRTKGDTPTVEPLTAPPYAGLLEKALKDPRFAVLAAAEPFAPEQRNGLGIEGLAATPDGQLLIGFRNPRPDGQALLLPLRNPAAVVEQGHAPDFGALVRLDLGGRGIRSLEATGDGYLVVAGPHDDLQANRKALSFELYRWAGPGSQPRQLAQRAFAGLHPEALFGLEGTDRFYVLSDDGGSTVDGRKCKSKKLAPERKRFRGAYLD